VIFPQHRRVHPTKLALFLHIVERQNCEKMPIRQVIISADARQSGEIISNLYYSIKWPSSLVILKYNNYQTLIYYFIKQDRRSVMCFICYLDYFLFFSFSSIKYCVNSIFIYIF